VNMAKTDSCMVCGYDLEYLDKSISSSCVYCTKVDEAYFICKRGHYVCEECHSGDIIEILTNFCLSSASENPLEMANILMGHEKMHMIGPEHHPMIAAVLVTAYKNKTTKATDEDIKEVLDVDLESIPASEMKCGYFGRNKHCNKENCRFFSKGMKNEMEDACK